MKSLRLGTRKSKLAWAQSSWVAEQITYHNPSLRVELVGITTEGDRIQDRPLQEAEGKDFFVKELDLALSEGRVDLCVHSYKDLSLERPSEFCIAAIPKRLPMHDIIVFRPGVDIHTPTLKIGTSSPRRNENIPPFLSWALPNSRVEMCSLRGNIHNRLQRLNHDLDAVVLAACGIERLYLKEPEFTLKLLEGCPWILAPLFDNPTAPAQGALAIECREDDHLTQKLLLPLHDAATEQTVQAERSLMAKWGGGCHQRFGISCLHHSHLGLLRFSRGLRADSTKIDDCLVYENEPKPRPFEDIRAEHIWHPPKASRQVLPDAMPQVAKLLNSEQSFFISHKEAWPAKLAPQSTHLLFCAGRQSWKALAKQGLWVNACADGLGAAHLWEDLQAFRFLRVPAWVNLSHVDACTQSNRAFSEEKQCATYKVDFESLAESLKGKRILYWSSKSLYDSLHARAENVLVHACGPGKTADVLIRNRSALVFYDRKSWEGWVKKCLKA